MALFIFFILIDISNKYFRSPPRQSILQTKVTTNTPKAEGLTAIEAWMLSCILFVFGALVGENLCPLIIIIIIIVQIELLFGEVHLTPQTPSETTPKPFLWSNLFQNMPLSCSTNRKQDLQTIEGHSMSRFCKILLLLGGGGCFCEYRRWCFEYVLIFCQHFCQCWYEMWQKSIQLWKQATPDVQIRPNIDFLCKYCRTLTKLFHIVYKDILFRFVCKEFVSRLCVHIPDCV